MSCEGWLLRVIEWVLFSNTESGEKILSGSYLYNISLKKDVPCGRKEKSESIFYGKFHFGTVTTY